MKLDPDWGELEQRILGRLRSNGMLRSFHDLYGVSYPLERLSRGLSGSRAPLACAPTVWERLGDDYEEPPLTDVELSVQKWLGSPSVLLRERLAEIRLRHAHWKLPTAFERLVLGDDV